MLLGSALKTAFSNTDVGSLVQGVGAIASMFGSSGGTNVAASKALSRYNMQLNKEYSEWLNKNSYSHMREGLENAGYNPMLALGASPQQGSVTSSTADNRSSVTPLNAVMAMNTSANTRLQEQQAETEIAKRENLKADTGMKLVDKLYKEGLIKWQDRQNYAELVLKNTTSQMNTANAKYANERSRGFSSSRTYNTAQGHDSRIFGLGRGENESIQQSYSKTW